MKSLSISLFLLLCCCMACSGPTEKKEATAKQDAGKLQANLTSTPTSEQGDNSGQLPTQAPLTLAASNPNAKKGEEVCVDVMVADFYNLLSMQYTMQWDPKVLTFSAVRGFNLPYLSKNSFGAHRTAEGLLTFVWIDDALDGKSLTDGSSIFKVCFQAVGNAGQSSSFKFVDKPTPFEVVNDQTQVIPLKGVEGKVTIN